jgi:hypothetical protein
MNGVPLNGFPVNVENFRPFVRISRFRVRRSPCPCPQAIPTSVHAFTFKFWRRRRSEIVGEIPDNSAARSDAERWPVSRPEEGYCP